MMMRTTRRRLATALFTLTALALSAAASAGAVEKVDLSELADGERREFASGDRTVVAERAGDVVTITMSGGDSDERTFDCLLGEDKCIIMTIDEDQGHKMKMMFLRHHGDEGEQDHDVLVRRFGDGDDDDGKRVIVTTEVDGEGGKKVIEKKVRVIVGDGEGGDVTWFGDDGHKVILGGDGDHHAVFVHEDDGAPLRFETITDDGAHVVFVGREADDKVMLRCPEGDTHMRVDQTEADVRYECPKHGQVLEQVESGHGRHMIRELRRKAVRDEQ